MDPVLEPSNPDFSPMEKVSPIAKLASFDEPWVPKVVAELNGQYVKVAHLEGSYVWHSHEEEDELFYVLAGRLDLELRDRTVELSSGELLVVPRGVEHRPVAHGRVQCLIFEPATTRNTGAITNEYTIESEDLERI